MTAHLNYDHRLAGTVKFDKTVSLETLVEIATELKSNAKNEVVDLHIRGAGDDGSRYLAFHIVLPDGKKKTCKKATHRLIDYLNYKLGTRPKTKGKVPAGVKGWSMATVDVVI